VTNALRVARRILPQRSLCTPSNSIAARNRTSGTRMTAATSSRRTCDQFCKRGTSCIRTAPRYSTNRDGWGCDKVRKSGERSAQWLRRTRRARRGYRFAPPILPPLEMFPH
jgi:hypothetical protein